MAWLRRGLLAAVLLVLTGFAAAPASAGEGAAGGPIYVRLRPISFSVIGQTNRIDKEVSLMIDLELEDGKTEPMFDPFRRQVMDNFLVALSEVYDEQKPGDPPVAGEAIKDKLLDVVTQIAGPGLVHSVLIISIGERAHAR